MNNRQPSDASYFRELRMQTVEMHRALRNAKDLLETIKAQSEQEVIESGFGGGKNAEERARSLAIGLAAHGNYQAALANLRSCEYEAERCEQLLEAAKDERRAAEWQIRAKLADGLFNGGVQSDSHDPLGDDAFDDDTLLALTNRLAALALRKDFQYRDVAREMIDAYNNGMADRINGAGEYEEDDPGVQNWLDAGRKVMEIDDEAYAQARAVSEDGADLDWF